MVLRFEDEYYHGLQCCSDGIEQDTIYQYYNTRDELLAVLIQTIQEKICKS